MRRSDINNAGKSIACGAAAIEFWPDAISVPMLVPVIFERSMIPR